MVNQGPVPVTRELFVGFRHFFKNYLSDFDIFYIFAADNQ